MSPTCLVWINDFFCKVQLTTADIDKSQSFRHALLLGHCFSNRKKFHGCRTTRESPRNTKAQFGKPRDERPYWLMILDMLRHFTQYDHLDLSLYVHDLEIPAFQHNYNEIGKRGKEGTIPKCVCLEHGAWTFWYILGVYSILKHPTWFQSNSCDPTNFEVATIVQKNVFDGQLSWYIERFEALNPRCDPQATQSGVP